MIQNMHFAEMPWRPHGRFGYFADIESYRRQDLPPQVSSWLERGLNQTNTTTSPGLVKIF